MDKQTLSTQGINLYGRVWTSQHYRHKELTSLYGHEKKIKNYNKVMFSQFVALLSLFVINICLHWRKINIVNIFTINYFCKRNYFFHYVLMMVEKDTP